MNGISALSRPGLRTKVSASVLSVACAGAMILGSAPARAGTTGMQKCLAKATPDETIVMSQTNGGETGFPAGPNPPNGIFPGNALHVEVEWDSKVGIATWFNGEEYDINGKAEQASSGYPFPGWPKYANLFRLNNNPDGWVASGADPNPWNPHLLRELSDAACFEAPALPVRLGVGMNDDNIGDNRGEWRWTLQIWRND